MKIDESTPCPACAIHVRAMYDAATVLVVLLEQSAPVGAEGLAVAQERAEGALAHATASLKAMLDLFAPWVEAHRADQRHAFSVELLDARHPVLEEMARLSPIDARD